MIAAQQQTQQIVAQSMLRSIAETICDRPEDTEAQRDARSRDVIHTVLGFQPRDPVEIMLAGMVVTHVHLVQDSARDVLRGQEELLKARTKSTIVALDRGMIGCLKELRMARTRALAAGDSAEAPAAADTGAGAMPAAVADTMPAAVADTGADTMPAAVEDAWAGTTPAAARGVPLAKPEAAARNPHIPRAPSRTPARTATPEPPVPLLPPLRRAETSFAAAMAVLSPPTTPRVTWANGLAPAAASPRPLTLP
jgi:hypothetical protein